MFQLSLLLLQTDSSANRYRERFVEYLESTYANFDRCLKIPFDKSGHVVCDVRYINGGLTPSDKMIQETYTSVIFVPAVSLVQNMKNFESTDERESFIKSLFNWFRFPQWTSDESPKVLVPNLEKFSKLREMIKTLQSQKMNCPHIVVTDIDQIPDTLHYALNQEIQMKLEHAENRLCMVNFSDESPGSKFNQNLDNVTERIVRTAMANYYTRPV